MAGLKAWSRRCALLLALLPGAAVAGMLWELRDAAGALRGHLFGTVHLCSLACYPLPASVREALVQSGLLALELDPEDDGMGAALEAAGRLPPGERLEAQLPAGLAARLDEVTGRLDPADRERLLSSRPWFAAALLTVHAAGAAGYHPAWGVDLWLAREARRSGRPVLALETVARQIEALAAGGEAAQQEGLRQVLDLVAGGGVSAWLERMRIAWQRGDTEALLRLLEHDADAGRLAPLLNELLAVRNREMAARVAAHMLAGERVFVAVGAAHLGGHDGLVARLAEFGLKAQPVDD